MYYIKNNFSISAGFIAVAVIFILFSGSRCVTESKYSDSAGLQENLVLDQRINTKGDSITLTVVSNEERLLDKYYFVNTKSNLRIAFDSAYEFFHTGGYTYNFRFPVKREGYTLRLYRKKKFMSDISFHTDSSLVYLSLWDNGKVVRLQYSNGRTYYR